MSIGADWRQISPSVNASVSAPAVAATSNTASATGPDASSNADEAEGRSFSEVLFGEDGFEFTDMLDVINPLQHIPIVGMLYRSITGDELGNGARVAGGTLFGGIFGLAGAAIDAVVDMTTGQDTGSHVMAVFESGEEAPDEGPVMANATPATGTSASESTAGNGLVLPWTAMDDSGAANITAAMLADDATLPDDIVAAPRGAVETVAMADEPGDLTTEIMSETTMASSSAFAAATASAPQAQRSFARDGFSSQTIASSSSTANAEPDPAELAVTLARAGRSDVASNLIGQKASSSRMTASTTPIRSDGETVWQRAQKAGRLNTASTSLGLDRAMVDANAKWRPAKAETPATGATHADDDMAPLSDTELMARFNAALKRDTATEMAAEARNVAMINPVADARPAKSAAPVQATADNSETAETEISEAHPLIDQVRDHQVGDAPVGAWFSQTMMEGLQKYQAMQSRQGDGSI
ncbi:hypothetical protein [Thalassospira sp.]|uniref:hypothetical protein n=1 Tax=Thalassospira sp. TaxID=1912094 RepID=UPI0027322DFE|nr:hypothetical protein [Thalassospira sp.]MDP2699224.1 hypothetical protein [Thalassospira sp.]